MNNALHTCQLLKTAACSIEHALSTALIPLKVSYCQATILHRLSESSTTMTELSTLLCCNKSNVTQVMSGLNKRHLVTKIVSKNDRRMFTLTLTAEGKKLAKEVRTALTGAATLCMQGFSETDAKHFAKFLEQCVQTHHKMQH